MQIFKSKFLKDIVSTYAVKIASVIFGVLTTIVTSKYVGPEGRGWMACAFTLAAVWASVGSFGINVSNLVLGAKDVGLRPKLAGSTILISLISTAVLTLLLVPPALLFPGKIPLPGVFLPGTIFYTLTMLLYLNMQSLLISFGMVKDCNIQEFFAKFGILAVSCAICPLGLASPGHFFLAAAVIMTLAALWCLRTVFKTLGTIVWNSWETMKKSASYNFRAFCLSIFSIMLCNLDIFVIQAMCGPAETGLYNISLAIRGVVFIAASTITSLLIPKISASCKNIREAMPKIWHIALIILPISLTMSLALWAAANWAISIVLNEDFLPSAAIFGWMIPGIVCYCCYLVMNTAFNLIGQPWSANFILCAAGVLDLCLCAIWHNEGGAGAAKAFSASCFLLLAVTIVQTALYMRPSADEIPIVSCASDPGNGKN